MDDIDWYYTRCNQNFINSEEDAIAAMRMDIIKACCNIKHYLVTERKVETSQLDLLNGLADAIKLTVSCYTDLKTA